MCEVIVWIKPQMNSNMIFNEVDDDVWMICETKNVTTTKMPMKPNQKETIEQSDREACSATVIICAR